MGKLAGRAAVPAVIAAAVVLSLPGVAAAQAPADPPAPTRGVPWRHCLAHNLKLYCPDRKSGRVVVVDLNDRVRVWRRG
ncbi:hypothetical protein AB0I10_17165 [Streptomyces sp. NPDC050636]|uniref:hypothetical protein n=1 Tax=Streptomyces sp. NPDC050636 TaxID=3154510 RepID=UPI003416F6DA